MARTEHSREGNVIIENGRFSAGGHKDHETVDGRGCYAVPGLVDIHFHGCDGADFCDGSTEAIARIAAYEAAAGITSICPATMTLPEEELLHIMEQPPFTAETGLNSSASIWKVPSSM